MDNLVFIAKGLRQKLVNSPLHDILLLSYLCKKFFEVKLDTIQK